jgi:hypothetical protein
MAQVMSDTYLPATFMSDQTIADENYHYLLELQTEEDARIASELQYQERAKCRKLNDRLLTAFESVCTFISSAKNFTNEFLRFFNI